MLVALPYLFVDGNIAFTVNLLVIEFFAPQLCWQWLVGIAFLTPSLSRTPRFWSR